MDQGIEYYEAKYRQQQLRGAAKQAAALKVQLVPLPELEVEFLLLGIDPAVVEGAYGAAIKSLEVITASSSSGENDSAAAYN